MHHYDGFQLITVHCATLNGTLQYRITLGKAINENLLVVIHTFSENDNGAIIRIISARKATKNEQRQYEESR
ncbi:MAG: BrnT family toxin [Burkholderiales bacterium]|nr:BrnT family toxin [Burkholderiales bacterium]